MQNAKPFNQPQSLLNYISHRNRSNSCNNVVGYFKKNLNDLFNIIKKTKIKYVKCIKANNSKLPFVFDYE